jgi:hypothetical protein
MPWRRPVKLVPLSSSHMRESSRIGKLHGADRASNRSYLLREVILEYHSLRAVLVEALQTEGPNAKYHP